MLIEIRAVLTAPGSVLSSIRQWVRRSIDTGWPAGYDTL
jgi:hypothetical protein